MADKEQKTSAKKFTEYWQNRDDDPRWLITYNFSEFLIYDMEKSNYGIRINIFESLTERILSFTYSDYVP